MSVDIQLIKIVDDLNNEFFDQMDSEDSEDTEDIFPFEFSTDGNESIVTFFGFVVFKEGCEDLTNIEIKIRANADIILNNIKKYNIL